MKNSKEYSEKYYQANKEQCIENARRWRRSEKGRAYTRRYCREHREQLRWTHRQFYERRKIDVLKHYGQGRCACVKCGESRLACLSIDHIDGGGCRQRQITGSGNQLYLWLRKNDYPAGYQTLCMNCQYVKRYEENECGYGKVSKAD